MSEPPSSSDSDASNVNEAFQFSEMAGPSSDTGIHSSSPILPSSSIRPTSLMLTPTAGRVQNSMLSPSTLASSPPQAQYSILSSPSIPDPSFIKAQNYTHTKTFTPVPPSMPPLPPLPSSVRAHPSMGPGFWVPAQQSMGPPVFVPENCSRHQLPAVTAIANTTSSSAMPPHPLAPRASMQRSHARNQVLRDKFEGLAARFRPSQTQSPNQSLLMQQMCFVADFGDLVDTHSIQRSRPSGLPATPEETPRLPTHTNRKRKWTAMDYPSSFFALCRSLWVVMLQTREFRSWLDTTIYLLRDMQNSAMGEALKNIRSAHALVISQLGLILTGENEGRIVYPDVKVSSPRLWFLLNEVFTEHGWITDRLFEIREWTRTRQFKMQRRQQQGFTARYYMCLEREIEQLSYEIVHGADKLEKMHKSFIYSFKNLADYLVENVCHVPTGGPLFEEETTPIQLKEIFEGYAMDPEVEALSWMKFENARDEFEG